MAGAKMERFRRDRSRGLRSAETDAERRFRRGLARIVTPGTHFRRQAPIGPYVVDFVCHGLKLIIEIDGGQHGRPDTEVADRKRAAFLENSGYRVIRFWNNDVMENLDGCLAVVAEAAAEGSPTSPSTGEVGRRSRPGGDGASSSAPVAPPLPGAARRPSPSRGGWSTGEVP